MYFGKELLGCLALMFQYFVGLELCNLVPTVRSLQKSRWTILSVLRVEPWGTLIEGYTRYNVWTDFLFILLPILQKLPSHEHHHKSVCVWTAGLCGYDYQGWIFDAAPRKKMTDELLLLLVAHTIRFNDFFSRGNNFYSSILRFFVFKMTEFDQAGKLRDFLEMLLI